jgi:hypothetical protein
MMNVLMKNCVLVDNLSDLKKKKKWAKATANI